MQRNISYVDKNSRAYLQKQREGGRYAMILIPAFTLLNLLLLLIDEHRYFLFSASVPYYMTLIGKGIDNRFAVGSWQINGRFTYMTLAIALVLTAGYAVLWLLSRKKDYPMVVAHILFILDTFCLLAVSVMLMDGPMSCLLDLFIHGWAMWEMGAGIRGASRLRRMDREEEAKASAVSGTPE